MYLFINNYMGLKEIAELMNQLKQLVDETTSTTQQLKNHTLIEENEEDTLENLKNIESTLDNINVNSNITKEEISLIAKSYSEIITNIKQWKQTKRVIENKEDIELQETVLLTIVNKLKDRIAAFERKSSNMKLKLTIRRLVNDINEQCKFLKVK